MACQFCTYRYSCDPYVQRLQQCSVRHDEQICSIGTSELPLTEKIGKIQRHLCAQSQFCDRPPAGGKASQSVRQHSSLTKARRRIPLLQRSIFVALPLRKHRPKELWKAFLVHFVT